MAEEKKKTKPKRPTAEKRIIQSEARRMNNRMFKSRVRTAINSYESAISENDKEKAQSSLKKVYSLFDKGVKKNIYKKNKAARSKSRLSTKLASL